jgi:hypothetical protein
MKRPTLSITFCLALSQVFSLTTISASQRRIGARFRYSARRHISSHGGHYAGGRGASHKSGHFRNVRAGNRYGRHK